MKMRHQRLRLIRLHYAATSTYKAVETCDAANNAIEIVNETEEEDLDDFNEIGKKSNLDVSPRNTESIFM